MATKLLRKSARPLVLWIFVTVLFLLTNASSRSSSNEVDINQNQKSEVIIRRSVQGWLRKLIFLVWLMFIVITLILIYLHQSDLFRLIDIVLNTFSILDVQEIVSISSPFAILLIAIIGHNLDGRFYEGGIRHRVYEIPKERRYNLDTDVIGATMTKQSVLAAVAGLFIFNFQEELKIENPNNAEVALQVVTAWFATIGFIICILLLLISMKCYDYASRFNWEPAYRARLVGKALRLDIASWYLLIFAFIVSINLISSILSIIASILWGFLLWYYYFFDSRQE